MLAAVIAVVLLPLAVFAVRVLANGWPNAGGDRALIELRTRDVGVHTPLLGSYSRYGFNHPGPLWFYVLANAAGAGTIDAAGAAPPANPSVDAVHRLARAALPDARHGVSLVTAAADPSQLLGNDPGLPTLVLDLERNGADVVVKRSLEDRYGTHSTRRVHAVRELRLLTDTSPVPEGFRVLAVADPLTRAQRAERNRLLARFPELAPGRGPAERLALVKARPELAAVARRLDATALPVVRLAVRPIG